MECLLVFANLIDEITFNYTTDSYKAPALHVMSLIKEALQTIENIDKGIIREGALQSVIQELRWSVEKDEIYNIMVTERGLSGLIPTISEGNSRSNLKTVLQMMDESISEVDYLQRIKESISDLIKEREKLLNQLAVLTGDSPYNSSEFQRSSLEDISFNGVIPKEISTDIIENRPDYIKAMTEVEKAGLDVKIAKKEFLPTFDIAGLALFNASDFASTLTTANSLLAFGAGVFQPIFTGGAKVANLRLKKASYERILENYKKTNLVAMQEINDSLVTIKQDEGKYSDTLKQLELSQKDYFYNKRRYEKGLISYLDLIQSEESVLSISKLVAIQKTDIQFVSQFKIFYQSPQEGFEPRFVKFLVITGF